MEICFINKQNYFLKCYFLIWFMFVISVNASSLYCGLPLFQLLDFLLTSFGLSENIVWCDWAEIIQCAKAFSVLSFSWLSLLYMFLLDISLMVCSYQIHFTALWTKLCSLRRLQCLEAPSSLSFCSVSVQGTLANMACFILIENKLKASKTKY